MGTGRATMNLAAHLAQNMNTSYIYANGLVNTLVLEDKYLERIGEDYVWTFWGREGTVRFKCPYRIHLKSELDGKVSARGSPKIVHTLKIASQQPIEMVIIDSKNPKLTSLKIDAVKLEGRMKALTQRVGLYDACADTIDICKNLGNALKKAENFQNMDILTNIRFIDGGVIHAERPCPECKGNVVYKYHNTELTAREKECAICGWRGYIELFDGVGGVHKIPLTTNVRKYLNELEIPDAVDIYESLFEKGIKPRKLIRNIEKIAQSDLKKANKKRGA